VPDVEKERRLAELQGLLRAQQGRFNADCVGLTLPVLFSSPGATWDRSPDGHHSFSRFM